MHGRRSVAWMVGAGVLVALAIVFAPLVHGLAFVIRAADVHGVLRRAANLDVLPGDSGRRRHHLHESVLQRAVKEAVRTAGLSRPATCHSLRHSFYDAPARGWI